MGKQLIRHLLRGIHSSDHGQWHNRIRYVAHPLHIHIRALTDEDKEKDRTSPSLAPSRYVTHSAVATSGFNTSGRFISRHLSAYRVTQGTVGEREFASVRHCSTVTGNRLEDDVGSFGSSSSQTVTGNVDSTTGVASSAETLGKLVTPQAQAASEVSAIIGDCSYPTAFLQMLIESVHVYGGLPWWAAIAATTLIIRATCLPVVIYQLRSAAKLSLMRPEMERINAEIKDSGYDPKVTAEARERITALFTKYNTTPFSPFVGALLQAPIFMCFFFGIRNMAGNLESFKDGGFLWFSDLTTPDTTYILPLLTSLGVLLTVELNAAEGMEGNPLADKMKKYMRIFAVVLFPISMSFEKALFFYWMTSNFWSLLQASIMKRPSVKNFLSIPATAHLAKPEPAVEVASAEPVKMRSTKPTPRKKLKSSRRR